MPKETENKEKRLFCQIFVISGISIEGPHLFLQAFFCDKKFCINIFCVTKFCTFISASVVPLLSKINVQIFVTQTIVMQKILMHKMMVQK